MTNYYAVGLCTIIGVTIFTLVYDSVDMDMYQCMAFQSPSSRSTSAGGGNITREFSPRSLPFDVAGRDVLVLVHIQKTGGSSLGRHIVHDLDIEKPCVCTRRVKVCECKRPGSDNENWLFSEFSVGWTCGLHADWTEMTSCVPSMLNKHENVKQRRRYFYATVLREPLARFLSEWQHNQRGATWKTSLHMCDGRLPTADELPQCYQGLNWKGVTLEEYLKCPYNLAFNRQTRMLADLSAVGCYNLSKLPDAERRSKMLDSAKRNLKRLAFLGIMEYQTKMQSLFEDTFKMKFRKDFIQINTTHAAETYHLLTDGQLQEVRRLNAEDFLLYDYAKELFLERFEAMQERHKATKKRA